MKKTSSRILLLILCVIMAMSVVNVSAFAAVKEPDETKASRYMSSYWTMVVPIGSGKLSIDFSVTASRRLDKIGASVISLYKSDGTLVKTFKYTNSGYANMMGSNTNSHTSSVTYAGISGQKYYAIVSFYGKDSAGADIKTYGTATVTA